MSEVITGYKGFDKDLKCRDMQYKIGEEFTAGGNIEVCDNGLHCCTQPIDVFKYYEPANNRFCEVEASGDIDTSNNDSKIASSKLKIKAEIGIIGLVKTQIEYVKKHTNFENTNSKQATAGEYGAATAGEYGAATAGYRGAAVACDRGAATAGEYGAATSRGSVSVGENGSGQVRGNGVKIKGGLGAVLTIVEENEYDYDIKEWKSFIVDGKEVKENTFYKLENGELKEC